MKITARAALELASHEGLVRQAYKDGGHNVDRCINNPQPRFIAAFGLGSGPNIQRSKSELLTP